MKSNNFSKALFYAYKAKDNELKNIIKHNEGIYFYKKGNIKKALNIFSKLEDEEMKKACYGKLYNILVKKVSNVKTLSDLKRHKSTYKKMLNLAIKMRNNELISSVKKTLSQI